MKKIYFYLFACALTVNTQAQEFINQVLILNEGYFDYTNNVIVESASVGSYDPETETYTEVLNLEGMRFGSDLIIDGDVYFIAADTKIFKVDLNSHEIISSVTCEGVRNLAKVGSQLFATRGEYMVSYDSYLHVYNTNDLSLEMAIDTTSGPKWATQNMVTVDNKVYIVVNNAYEWGNEKGIIGVLNADNLVYETEYDLGENASNPDNLVKYGDFLYTINNKDWSTGASVSKLAIDLSESETVNISGASTGCGTSALRDDKMVYQISSENSLNTFDLELMNNTGPISGSFYNFYSLKQDPVNSYLYTSETDYFSFGQVHVYDEQNIEIKTFDTGISPGTIVFDIQSSAGIEENYSELEAYPNPVQSVINTNNLKGEKVVRNMIGEEVMRFTGSSAEASSLPSGMYWIVYDYKSIPFIKK